MACGDLVRSGANAKRRKRCLLAPWVISGAHPRDQRIEAQERLVHDSLVGRQDVCVFVLKSKRNILCLLFVCGSNQLIG